MFNFLMGEASPENRINLTSIQGIIQDEVVFRVVTDTMVIVTGKMWLKSLCLEINKKIYIPRIDSANQEQEFI